MSAILKRFPVRLDVRRGTVDMTHGSGGRAMAQLIEELFVKHLDNALLCEANDYAAFAVRSGRMVMSTDGHVMCQAAVSRRGLHPRGRVPLS